MVSTHSAYLTEFNSPLPASFDTGKSPLALLAKTCETIGLPEIPVTKKSGAVEKCKDGSPPNNHDCSKKDLDVNGHTGGNNSKRKDHHHNQKSPRIATVHSPATATEDRKKTSPLTASEPSTSSALPTTAGLTAPGFPSMLAASRCYPMMPFATFPGFTAMPFGYAPSAAMPPPSYPMFPTYAGGIPFASPFMRCQDLLCKGNTTCPSSMVAAAAAGRATCVTPGCTNCAQASAATDLMLNLQQTIAAAYAHHPFPNAMPVTSTAAAANMALYHSLMAAASGNFNKSGHVCNWVDSPTGICGRSFANAEELAAHIKTHSSMCTTSETSSTSHTGKISSSPKTSTTTTAANSNTYGSSSTSSSLRFHPYKLPTAVPSSMNTGSFVPSGFPNNAAALQAMYSQRLLSAMPHP